MLPPEISLNSELASSGNLNLLQHYSCCLLLHGLCDVRLCRMYTKWSQIHEITLPGALVCGCHSWHSSNDHWLAHCHCHCIQLDNELRSFCFPFFASNISWPHFAISACPRALSLLRNSVMPPYSTDDQKIWTSDPECFDPRRLPRSNWHCFFPCARLASHFSHQCF